MALADFIMALADFIMALADFIRALADLIIALANFTMTLADFTMALAVHCHGSQQEATVTGRCNCRRSRCNKKYCECFNACVECTSACKCADCSNRGGPIQVQDRGCTDIGVTVWILPDGAFTPTCSSIGIEEELDLQRDPAAPLLLSRAAEQQAIHGLNSLMFECPPSSRPRRVGETDPGVGEGQTGSHNWKPNKQPAQQDDADFVAEISESLSDDQLEAVLRMIEAPTKRPRRVPSAEWGLAMQEGVDSDEDEDGHQDKRARRSDSMPCVKREVSLGRQMSDELFNKLVLGRSLSNERLALLMNTSDSDWNLMLTKQSSWGISVL
eukprot:TRINITY_DN13133_c0_g1_i12.p1 TRINITY_DN13133_c0_g1~~TRINITY_DN13133_c0_g1_i12.p1  ORF type:complete len:327 (-),score=72.76 TRINITY_DN13133_c0_g1_i12:239-1219(-)